MAGWKKVIVSGSVAELHTLSISSASNAGLDTDKFLVVSSSGVVHFRTGAEVLSDIGAGAGSGDISSVVAGDGLTGGASTGDATLNVVGGTGITANANDIQITDGGVGTTQLADDAVTEDKLANTLLAEIDANTAKVTNVSTNLSKTTAAAQITINSSDGDNVIIGEATDTIAGLMSTTHHDKLDGIEASADVTDTDNVTSAGALMDSELATIALVKALTPTMISGSHTALSSSIASDVATNTAKVTNVSTNLTITGTTEARVIVSSDGTDATIPVATTSVSGLMNTTLFDKLDGIEASADVTDTDNVTSAGALMDTELATIALVKALTPTMISGSHTALSSSIAADVATNTAKATNVTTNLSITGTTGARTIVSSDGTNAIIPAATDSVSGVMSAADHTKLTGIETGADVTDTTNVVAALTAGTNVAIAGDGTISSTDTNTQLSTEQVQDIAGPLVATGGTKTGITVTYDDTNGNMDFVVASQTDENFTTADHSKLDGIEASADVTDTTNVKTALNASLGGAATIGDSSDTITIPGNLTITGTRTELQVTNLNVEDQFILLNSGSTSGDSGIIFGGTGNGTAQAGHSIFCDDSDGDGATFGYKSQLAHNVTTGGTPTSKLGNIESSTSAPSTAPTFQGVGTIHIKTDSEEIYIYA